MKAQSLSFLALALAVLLAAPPADATGVVNPKVEGDTLEAKIRLPGVGADLTVAFEQVVGLSAESLGLSAGLLDAGDLLALQSRLPSGLVSVPAGFPVLVTIEPPATGGLSFSGVVSIELYTHDLAYVPGSPLRLFAAPLGGSFDDITETTAGGSYRVRGHKGDFSEFLIVADLRPVDVAIVEKFTSLDAELTSHGSSISPTVYSQLVTLLAEAEAAYRSDDLVTAISKVEELAAAVKAASGTGIPDVWRSSRDLVNVAGVLRAGAGTLRFSLILKANAAS